MWPVPNGNWFGWTDPGVRPDEWAKQTPFMVGFRQMMFSKIVPNLKRLGLLTPRVREAYEKLDLLKFENHKDSVEEPEVTPPHELVELMMQIMAKSPASQAGTAAPA